MNAVPERRRRPPRPPLLPRMLFHGAIAASVLGGSLGIGMWGYAHYEGLGLRDAFLNASMILGGMGPVKTDLSDGGKVFAGLYALYSGVVFIAVAGLLLGPLVHSLMHHVHWADEEDSGAKGHGTRRD